MISMRLSQAALPMQAVLHGDDVDFVGCTTDTRTLKGGELFVALKGANYDGHDMLGKAIAGGAKAAVVERHLDEPIPLLVVGSTRESLGRLAAAWRARYSMPLIGITGSNGKTTVKEMLASILGVRGSVLATSGNLNNDLGVPLTLFNLDAEHDYAVVEMGANHAGEIAWLAEIAKPSLGLVTLVAEAHLEGFGTLAGVARAKGELFAGLAADGIAVLNSDDPFADVWRKLISGRKKVSFSRKQNADVTAVDLGPDENRTRRMRLTSTDEQVDLTLPLLGAHNVSNALAASACAYALGIDLQTCRTGLERMRPVAGRLQLKRGKAGSYLIDDTYNANPSSLEAAMDVLDELPGERWLVLGDMGELGSGSRRLHLQAGEKLAASKVSRLFAIGQLASTAAGAFAGKSQCFKDAETGVDDLVNAIKSDLNETITVLVKGSRTMRLERVVNALAE
jgi:UDP-N-acetylmuramoyl-tripeptide--D-alanyl-D-alanine ligase